MVPLPKKWSGVDTVITRTSLPNLWHPAGAIPPPLLKSPKSTINKLHESDVVPAQALLLPMACGDQHIPQPKAGRDHNILWHQKVTLEVANQLMEANRFGKTPWPIISNEKDSMFDDSWKLAIEAQDCQWLGVGPPVGTPCVWQLPGGPFLRIDQHTQDAVSV
jgi:hypothetical protein